MASKSGINPELLDAIKESVSSLLDTGTEKDKDAARKLVASYPGYLREAIIRFMRENPSVSFVAVHHKASNGNPDAKGPRTVIVNGKAFPKVPSSKGSEGYDFAPVAEPSK